MNRSSTSYLRTRPAISTCTSLRVREMFGRQSRTGTTFGMRSSIGRAPMPHGRGTIQPWATAGATLATAINEQKPATIDGRMEISKQVSCRETSAARQFAHLGPKADHYRVEHN